MCFPQTIRYNGRRSEGLVMRSPGQLEQFLPVGAFQCNDLWAKTRGSEYLRANIQFSSDSPAIHQRFCSIAPGSKLRPDRIDGGASAVLSF